MKTYTYNKSQALFKKAAKVIPCGIYGHYSPAPLIPATDYPFYAGKAKGSKVWDIDGNEFIDYMCAYGPMVTGYNNKKVDDAAMKQLKEGNCMTGAPPVMVELAEYLVSLIPIAKWAFFAKNGGDITNYSIMIAREATGKKKIIKIGGGYHGVAAWMQAPGHHGTISDDHENFITIPWNDFAAFERAVQENPGQIAGFISTPYHHPVFVDNEYPQADYWQKIEALCRKEGIVMIIDDVRCGFRLDMGGSNEFFGFKPDLICFCKAIANGHPISALVGNEDMRPFVSNVFYTGSYWFSAVPMAAALANLKEMKKMNAPKKMLTQGKKLTEGLIKAAADYGYELKVTGAPSMPYLRITNDSTMMLHQDWCSECTKRGAYFTSHHNWFLSTAHSDSDIKKTIEIAHDAFKVVKKKYGDRF